MSEQAKPYLADLEELKAFADALPDSRMLAIAKISALTTLNMRWEKVMVDRDFPEHPWPHVAGLIRDARSQLEAWSEAAFIEGDAEPVAAEEQPLETRHRGLFQSLWVSFSEDDYRDRIERYRHRLRLNGLAGDFLAGRRCIDLGCGHGNFAHALLAEGAKSVLGIDFGDESIRYARAARDRLSVPPERIDFRVESVYSVAEPDGSFDLALQNGVFHHLEDEDAAYAEAARLLKRGGWIWIYSDGSGAVSHDLWDASVHILRQVPDQLVLTVLDFLGIETNKRYHLGDGLNATYRHATFEQLGDRLAAHGFGNLRRLIGGFPTDFDHDAIEADRWGVEKFGSGDLRVLAQKL